MRHDTHRMVCTMPYSAEISRDNRTAFLFVIDQSGSMDERPEGGRMKSEFVADVLNKTLYTLVTSCSKADGIRDYFDIGVLGYNGAGVSNGLGGSLANGGAIHPISAIADGPLLVEERARTVDDGAGGVVEQKAKFPVWFDPKNEGGTPMRAALTQAAELLADWCDTHPNSYPPTILHVTDGEATDGNPEDVAQALWQLHTMMGRHCCSTCMSRRRGAARSSFRAATTVWSMITPACSTGCRARCPSISRSSPATRAIPSPVGRAASSSTPIRS